MLSTPALGFLTSRGFSAECQNGPALWRAFLSPESGLEQATGWFVCTQELGLGLGRQGPTASGAVELKTSSSALFPMKPGNFRFSCLLGRQERQEFQNFIPSIRPSLKNAALPSISSLVSSLSQVFITHFFPPSTLWFELLQCLSVLADVVNKLS